MSLSEQDLYIAGAIGLLTLCSVITRASFNLFGHRIPLSDKMRRALLYAPAAALTAIIVPTLLPWVPGSNAALVDEKLFAAIIAIVLFQRTRSTIIMIVGGMVSFWLIQALFSFW
jgi:branched-subunit amino acid transport protein|tara:strand:- start:446 stop:790 length:345 start_codon:yes stop_codon:yes gene_type:complete